ncbi:MAG: ester cyclase [Acidimicrobiales bacterium]|nr:ester cyclase [Actinomycetota bacterium]
MGTARELAEQYYERFGAGDFEGATSLFADDCVTVTPSGSFSPGEHEAFGRAFRNALPDAHMELVRAVEADDEVYITGRFKGTHEGDLISSAGTIPASGNTLDMPFADYFRVSGGVIAEHEVIWDQMTLLGQLGALPQG